MLLLALLAAAGSITGTVASGGPLRTGTNAIPAVERGETLTTGWEMVTFSCAIVPACTEEQPSTPSEPPSCADYNLDTALIENAKHGDRSAIELLQQRYASTFTDTERFRIGGALLGRVRDDSVLWSEMSVHAERIIETGGDPEKLDAYGTAHGYEPYRYSSLAWDAFFAISRDRRARPLLLRVLAVDDRDLPQAALIELAFQPGEPPLAEIEAALKKHPDLIFDLADEHFDELDAFAMKVLKTDADRAEYRRRAETP